MTVDTRASTLHLTPQTPNLKPEGYGVKGIGMQNVWFRAWGLGFGVLALFVALPLGFS